MCGKTPRQHYGFLIPVFCRMPTFKLFKNRQLIKTIKGADPKELSAIVKKLANEAESMNETGGTAESSGSASWMGGDPAKGYSNITDQTDLKGLELLNFDSELGNVRTLFESSKPSALSTGDKSKIKDWVESDTDDQLMLYIPFQATLKIHSIHLTSIPPYSDDDEVPMRPKTVQVYVNRSHILGFEEAEDSPVTQSITINSKDWDDTTGTAKMDLRFVKFQNVTSLVLFVVNGDGEGEKVRLDRVRVVGETGERRDGKIEKMGDDHD